MPDSTYNTCIFIKKCLKYSFKKLQLYNFWRSIEIMLYIQTYWSRSSRTKEWNSFQYDKTITKTGANFILKTTIYTKHKINNLKFSHVIPWSHTANNLGWRLKYTHASYFCSSQPTIKGFSDGCLKFRGFSNTNKHYSQYSAVWNQWHSVHIDSCGDKDNRSMFGRTGKKWHSVQ